MAAILLFGQPFLYIVDADGNPVVGAKATFFIAGLSTPQAVYTSSALSTTWAQPIVTNAAGQSSGPIFLSPTPALKVVVVDADDVPIPGYPVDHVSPAAVAS